MTERLKNPLKHEIDSNSLAPASSVKTSTPLAQSRSFFMKNWMSLLGIVTSVISIVIALYLYNPVAERVPTLLVDPLRTTIIDSKLFPNSSLKVIQGNNVIVQDDVTALRFYFWNAGKQSIKQENVLRPLTVFLNDPAGKILDFKILKVSRPDVVNVKLTPSNKNPEKELLLEFNILEENDGIACQIIYAGNPSAELTPSGVVEGVRRISSNETVSGGQFWSELLRLLPIYLAVIMGIILFILFIGLAFRIMRWRGFIMDKTDIAQGTSYEFVRYVARALPYLVVGAIIIFIVFTLFILIPRESAQVNVVKAVPTSIKP